MAPKISLTMARACSRVRFTAGVIKAGESVRFGWHNVRHSLATFFGSQEIPVQVIQKMLRQKKLEMTLHYMHGVNKQHMDAQNCTLMRLGLAEAI
jgi:site-specific recombinase XerD